MNGLKIALEQMVLRNPFRDLQMNLSLDFESRKT
jgi:hypothetical protein